MAINLVQKMRRWEILMRQLEILEKEIKDEVMRLGETRYTEGVVASLTKGRGNYDYEAIAKRLSPPEEVVTKYTKVVVDWRAVCEEVGIPLKLKEKHYTPGTPSVSIKLVKKGEGK